MAVAQIPNLPGAIALTGPELFEAVQAGVSVKVTAKLIQTYAGSYNVATELLTIVTLNTIPNLGHFANGKLLSIAVNNQVFYSVGTYPPFTVSGAVITWNGYNYTNNTVLFSVNPGDVVVAQYSY